MTPNSMPLQLILENSEIHARGKVTVFITLKNYVPSFWKDPVNMHHLGNKTKLYQYKVHEIGTTKQSKH